MPEWYERALAAERRDAEVQVAGCKIHYATWGQAGLPGLVLVHGSNAHLEWWRFVAPFLADQFHVAALDLSGNGDSGWRQKYTGELFAQEVKAVCDHAGLGERPFIVAHSFGGFVALETGHRYGKDLGGILFMDFTISPPEQYIEWGKQMEIRGGAPARPTRIYDDYEAALGRFRFLPEQPVRYPEALRYLATQSLRQVEGGWTWKFDPSLFDHLEMGMDQRDKFAGLLCRSAVLLGEQSADEGAWAGPYMAEITDGALPIFSIPGTHHHLMFDEPLAVVAAIKGTLLGWIREDRQPQMQRALAASLR